MMHFVLLLVLELPSTPCSTVSLEPTATLPGASVGDFRMVDGALRHVRGTP